MLNFNNLPAVTMRWLNHRGLFVSLLLISTVIYSVGASFGQNVYVGSNSSGQTTNYSSGTNSYLNIYDGYSGSSNSFRITNGAVVNDQSGFIGFSNAASKNSALVTGSNASWNNTYGFYVGYSGYGNTMVVSNFGAVNDQSGFIGYSNNSSNNSVLVTGGGSLWVNSSALIVGNSGSSNSLVVSNGGGVVGSNGYIGFSNTSSYNSVFVANSNAFWNNANSLVVGVGGWSNALIITNSGTVNDQSGYIGYSNSSSNNSVVVTGNSSAWSNADSLYVGYGGAGNNLLISSAGGGIVNYIGYTSKVSDNNGYIGFGNNSSNNSVLVTGGWVVSVQNYLNGAFYTNTTKYSTTWMNNSLFVGYSGSGNSMVVSNIAAVINQLGYIGYNNSSSNNSVLVTGSNSTWNNNSLYVGYGGSGNSMVITNNGTVNSQSGNIGNFSSTNNYAMVTGAGSSWNNYSTLAIASVNNRLLISNGGSVSMATGIIGDLATETKIYSNPVISTNTFTQLIPVISHDMYVGTNRIIVPQVKAYITVTNTFVITNSIGYQTYASSNNSVLVNGTNSKFISLQSLIIGNSGVSNSLVISNGGIVSDGSGSLGTANTLSSYYTTTNELVTKYRTVISPIQGIFSNYWITNTYYATNYNYLSQTRITSSGNSALVTGANSVWTNSGDLTIGVNGSTNSLVISNGASVINGISAIGGVIGMYSDASNNSVLVTGSNSSWTILPGSVSQGYDTYPLAYTYVSSSSLYIGYAGSSNSLIVSNGGAVYDQQGYIGYAGHSNYTVPLPNLPIDPSLDDGSGWGTGLSYQLYSLMISSNNLVQVSGSNSLWSNTLSLTVGYAGSGNSLLISNGGRVVDQQGYIGYAGQSNYLVQDLLGLYHYAYSNFFGSNNSVFVIGTNSLWTNSGDLVVGVDGTANSLVISNGGTVMNGQSTYGGVIGLNADSLSNSVLVTGTNSLWTNRGDFIVGVAGGANSLIVSNGGKIVDNTGYLGGANYISISPVYFYTSIIGYTTNVIISSSSLNTVLVTGSNSLWSNTTALSVGYGGVSNSLIISNGGQVIDQTGYIGYTNIASNNSVLVTGYNSLWSNSSSVIVGQQGSGNSLVISNAGIVRDQTGLVGYGQYNITNYIPKYFNDWVWLGWIIGYEAILTPVGPSNNSVLVTGSNSLWTNTGDITIGVDGSGNSLVISNAGTVVNGSSSNGAVIGLNGNSFNNSVLVTGTNSLWSNTTPLSVGYGGSGNSLAVSNGGTVNDQTGYIGYSSSASNNSVLVSGTNSFWRNSGNLSVGYYGSANALVISNGGLVVDSRGYVGLYSNSFNSALVTGSNSLWTNGSDFYVGNIASSANSLLISSGATVVDQSGYIGNSATANNNSVLVSDTGSLWSNSSNIYVGYAGSGNSLTISNGGRVLDGSGYIGYSNSASNNSVLVTGTGSLWSNSGTLTIGSGIGSNSLTIAQGGRVLAQKISILSGALTLGTTNGLGNTPLTLGGGSQSSTLALATSPSIASLVWASNGVVALTPASQQLGITGVMSNSGGGGTLSFPNPALNNSTNSLISFGSQSGFTTNSFSVQGITGYSFILSPTNVSAYIGANAAVSVSSSVSLTNTLQVSSFTVNGGTATITTGGTLTTTSPVVINAGTLVDNGTLKAPNLTIAPNAVFTGSGTLTDVLNNAGTIIMNGLTINEVD